MANGHGVWAAPSAATRLVGVMGAPVAHSLSPRLHNAAFAELGLDWVSVGFAVPSGRAAPAIARGRRPRTGGRRGGRGGGGRGWGVGVNGGAGGMDDPADAPTRWPVDPALLRSGQRVVDLVYHPPVTPWLAAAADRGAEVANGLGMLVHQAA